MDRRLTPRHRAGFTLVELLIGIGIIGVLSAVVIVAVNPSKQLCDTKNAARSSHARHLQDAVYQYLVKEWRMPQEQDVPIDEANAKPVCAQGVTGDTTCVSLDVLVPAYLAAIPRDDDEPNPAYSGFSIYKTAAGRAFVTADHLGSCAAAEQQAAPGLVARWTFNELTGTEAVDTVGGRALTLGADNRWMCGGHDGAYGFAPGVFAWGPGDATLNFGGSAFTIAAFLRLQDTGADAVVFSQRDGCGPQHIQLYAADHVSCGGKAAVSFGDSAGNHVFCCSASMIPAGTWTHLLGTYDGAALRVYLNGTLNRTCAQPGKTLMTGVNNLQIGHDTCGAWFGGDIDDVQLFSIASDDQAAAALAASFGGGSCQEPTATCGNGAVESGEGCDDGNADSCDGCTLECVPLPYWSCEGSPSSCGTVCGDGWRAGGEECDDGNESSADGCGECALETGYVWEVTQAQGNGCESPSEGWVHTACGDGMIVGDEACDDGNPYNEDGCNESCEVEEGWTCNALGCTASCGDGALVGDEACDDGNPAAGDGCSQDCVLEEGWTCEDAPSVCITACGDGIIAGEEECDDQGTLPGDGCSADCAVEEGWSCENTPSSCATACGDGIIAGDEACDDDNLSDGDGCTAECLVEYEWSCVGQPSVCSGLVEATFEASPAETFVTLRFSQEIGGIDGYYEGVSVSINGTPASVTWLSTVPPGNGGNPYVRVRVDAVAGPSDDVTVSYAGAGVIPMPAFADRTAVYDCVAYCE